MVTKTPVYVSDFETRAGDKAKAENKVWVWAWAGCSILDIENVEIGTSIEFWFSWIKSLRTAVVYFHNLKFDGFFVLYFLMTHGYHFTDDLSQVRKGGKYFTFLVSENRVFYTITFGTGYGAYVELRDSFKKLPFALDKIGDSFKTKYQKLDLDYVIDRAPDHKLEPEEEEYLKADVRVIAEALHTLYEDGHTAITIGSDCLRDFKNMFGGKKKFRDIFPILDTQADYFARKAYRGGWCYVNPKYQGYTLKFPNGVTYDVNSLYPSMLHSNEYELADGTRCRNLYPYGEPVYYKGEYKTRKTHPLYVCHINANFKIKDGHVPTIQIKNHPYKTFKGNEYIYDSLGMQELYLTNVDYELFLKHYDILEIEFIDGYMYRGYAGFFDEYVNRYFDIKIASEGAVKEEAKLFLNNLYGKFVQKIMGYSMVPILENGIVKLKRAKEEVREAVYAPVGAFNTAYSRRFTITAAQVNYNIFAYADTDSGHFVDTPVGINEHPYKLSYWKRENTWTQARFIRQKAYMELNSYDTIYDKKRDIRSKWMLKCAGMNAATKTDFIERMNNGEFTPEDFDIGLEILGKKLKPIVVEGGVLLVNTDFKMRAS